ncbi:MAG: alpha/beta hydrolase, partial [Anaerolineae bacterium]|nr:alpha/beta hydrolase [Anaerolineae bacterium]
ALQQSHYCVAIDLLGHGHSEKPRAGDYSIPAQAARVLKIADALGLETFTWIGHSMGGQIGLYTAAHMPERLSRMVSVSGVVTGKLSAYVRWMLSPIYRMGALCPPIWDVSRIAIKYPWYSSIFDHALVHRPRLTPIDDMDRQMAMVPGIEIPAYRDLQAIAALDLTPLLASVQAPTLAIFGKQDNTVPVENGHLVERHVPNSRLVLLDNCGHIPMTEQTTTYLDVLCRFLGA